MCKPYNIYLKNGKKSHLSWLTYEKVHAIGFDHVDLPDAMYSNLLLVLILACGIVSLDYVKRLVI